MLKPVTLFLQDNEFKSYISSRYPEHKMTIFEELFLISIDPIKVKDIYILSNTHNPLLNQNESSLKSLKELSTIVNEAFQFIEDYIHILRTNYDNYKMNKKSFEESTALFQKLESIHVIVEAISFCKTISEFDHIVKENLNELNTIFNSPLTIYRELIHAKLIYYQTFDIDDNKESYFVNDEPAFEKQNLHSFESVQEIRNQLISLKNQLNIIDNPQFTKPNHYAKALNEVKIKVIQCLNDIKIILIEAFVVFEHLYIQRRTFISNFYLHFIRHFEICKSINLNVVCILKLIYLVTQTADFISNTSDSCLKELKSVSYPLNGSSYNMNILMNSKDTYDKLNNKLKLTNQELKAILRLNDNKHLQYLKDRLKSEVENTIIRNKKKVEGIKNILDFYEVIANSEKKYWTLAEQNITYINRTAEVLKNHQFKKGEEVKLHQEAINLISAFTEIISKIKKFNKIEFYQNYYPKFLEFVRKLNDSLERLAIRQEQISSLISLMQNLPDMDLKSTTRHFQDAVNDRDNTTQIIQNSEATIQRNLDFINDKETLKALIYDLKSENIEILIGKLLNLIRDNHLYANKLDEIGKTIHQNALWKLSSMSNKMQNDVIYLKYIHLLFDNYNFFNSSNIISTIQILNPEIVSTTIEDLHNNLKQHLEECQIYKQKYLMQIPNDIVKILSDRLIFESGILMTLKLIQDSLKNVQTLVEYLKKNNYAVLLFDQNYHSSLSKLIMQLRWKINIEDNKLNTAQTPVIRNMINVHYTNLNKLLDLNEDNCIKLIKTLEFLTNLNKQEESLLIIISKVIEQNTINKNNKINSWERSAKVDKVIKVLSEFGKFYESLLDVKTFLKNLGMKKFVRKIENLGFFNEKVKEFSNWNDFLLVCIKYIKELSENEEDPEYSVDMKDKIIQDFANKFAKKKEFNEVFNNIKLLFEANF